MHEFARFWPRRGTIAAFDRNLLDELEAVVVADLDDLGCVMRVELIGRARVLEKISEFSDF